MKELSLHILDIVQNSIRAEATDICVKICENTLKNLLEIQIIDNGTGMDQETLNRAIDPFWTSRTTRKVGLGIPLFKAAAEACEGFLDIKSKLGEGTEVTVQFQREHIDRAPLGNMAETMSLLIMTNEHINFLYSHIFDEKEYTLDTKALREILGDVPLSNLDVVEWIKSNIKEGLTEIGCS